MRACLVAAVLWLLLVPAAAQAQLVGQWHLDEDVAGSTPDSSGNGLDGATDAIGVIADGRFGNAFRFDFGSSVRVADSALLEPQKLSVVAWVRANASFASRYIVAKGGDDVCSNSSYALATGSGGLVFYVRDAATTNAHVSPAAAAAIWDGDWHAVTGTYDGAAVRLYVDGVQVGSGTPTTTTVPYGRDDDTLAIGTYPQCAGSGFDFPGDVDEVRVYNRALTPAEVTKLHDPSATAPPVLPPPGGGGGGGPAGPVSKAPTARFTAAKSPTLRRAIRLSGVGSTAVAGRAIKSYAWDFNDDGIPEATCDGAAPAVSRPFRTPGRFTVALTVTDSAGLTATARQPVSVAATQVNRARRDVYDCEAPLGGNQADRPGCVKTFAFGYVEVNGRGDPDQCFTVEGRPRQRDVRAQAAQRGTLKDYILYHASIEGPVALNGLPIPVPKGVKSQYDSGTDTIGIGSYPIVVPKPGGGTFKVADVPLEKKIDPQRTRDYPDGVFTLFSGKLEGDLKGWGGLKRGAGIEVLLLRRASVVKVAIKLPNVFTLANRGTVEAWAAVRATNAKGFEFDGMRIGPVDAFLGPVIVSNIQFTYSRSADLWEGGADIQLLPAGVTIKASPPPPDFGLGLRGGAFDHAGFGAKFDVPPQLFPGIGLREIGGSIGIRPLRFTGRMAINAGGTVTIDSTAFLAFASPEQPYDFPADLAPPGLGFLGGRRLDSYSIAIGGTASLTVPRLGELPLLNAYVFYAYPDYVEFAGLAEIKPFGDKFKIKGDVSGFTDVSRELFNLEGGVQACVDISVFNQCLDAGAVVSSKGIAFCTVVPLPVTPVGPVLPVPAGVGYKWGQGFPPDIMIFSCDRGPYREVRPSAVAAQAGARPFEVPAGAPSASVRIVGAAGPPKVVLTGPKGERITLPQTDPATANRNAIALTIPETRTTEVFLKQPSAGRWTVAAQPGSSISGVAAAMGLPDPRVRARVVGRGRQRTLVYRVGAAPGQRVTFVERGARTASVLGRATGPRGRIRFTPAAGRRGRRQIVALIERGGVTVRSLPVARYDAPTPARPARPRGLSVSRRGTTLLVRWRRAAGARAYAVTVRTRFAPAVLRVTRRTRIRVVGIPRRATVLVGALTAGSRTGPQARRTVRASGKRKRGKSSAR